MKTLKNKQPPFIVSLMTAGFFIGIGAMGLLFAGSATVAMVTADVPTVSIAKNKGDDHLVVASLETGTIKDDYATQLSTLTRVLESKEDEIRRLNRKMNSLDSSNTKILVQLRTKRSKETEIENKLGSALKERDMLMGAVIQPVLNLKPRLPLQVDTHRSLTDVTYNQSNRQVVYSYVLSDSHIDVEKVTTRINNHLSMSACLQQTSSRLMNAGISIKSEYIDSTGKSIGEFTVTHQTCKKTV